MQADGAADAQRWLEALRRHSAEPPPAEQALPPAPASAPPTTTTAPECPSPLPPQRAKKIGRNRSPTGEFLLSLVNFVCLYSLTTFGLSASETIRLYYKRNDYGK